MGFLSHSITWSLILDMILEVLGTVSFILRQDGQFFPKVLKVPKASRMNFKVFSRIIFSKDPKSRALICLG
jgi:hypothetical protein